MTEQCQWCGRAGQRLALEMRRDRRVTLKDPVLCDVCAPLIGFTSGGGADADERREEAVETVVAHLEEQYAVAG